jgi:hypothetical protein
MPHFSRFKPDMTTDEVISGNTEVCFKKCVESLLLQARAYQAENRARAVHRFFLAPVAMDVGAAAGLGHRPLF